MNRFPLLEKFGFKNKQVTSDCEAILFMGRRRADLGRRSFKEILESGQRYFRTSQRVQPATWQSLFPDYKLTYLVAHYDVSAIDQGPKSVSDVNSFGITKKPVKNSGIEDLLGFLKRNFYERWSEHRSAADYELAVKATPAYYEKDLRGFWYLKEDVAVALLVLNKVSQHPAIGHDVIHIGHWGYLPELITKSEAESIKSDWIAVIQSFSAEHGGLPLTGVIDDFNFASLDLADKLGFKIHSFRLDRRG